MIANSFDIRNNLTINHLGKIKMFKYLLILILSIQLQAEIISPAIADFDCHGSSLVEVNPGTLCVVFKGGPGKGLSNIDMKENVGIWMTRYENNQWSAPALIVETPDSVCWTPVLCQRNDELLLFYRVGAYPRTAVSMLKRSLDGGRTWSEPELLPAGIVGPLTSPIFDAQGNMYCGSSVEAGAFSDTYKATACWVEVLSSDGIWYKYGPLEIPGKRFGAIEPSLFWGEDGSLKLLCRDRANKVGEEGWIWSSVSSDLGKTWAPLVKTNLPNPDSGICTLDLGKGEILLFYNNSHTNRYPLSIALSKDYGTSWTPLYDVGPGEFPSAIIDSVGIVHLIYAEIKDGSNQRQITHNSLAGLLD